VDLSSVDRLPTGWGEIDRVLGGGLVPGSLVLIGGEPGVGKSTLLMHIAHQVACSGGVVLYASGEESAQQIRLRSDRLGSAQERILLLAENELGAVSAVIDRIRPAVAVVDSIQMVSDPDLDGSPGSVTQVREAAGSFMRLAKGSGVPIILVGHVTKEGSIAGPRVLEHLVDTVMYLEGDRTQDFRILRATKNRFGSTDEIGIFTMGSAGLVEVPDPSALLVDGSSGVNGSAVTVSIEGNRPLMVEIQTLIGTTPTGLPRRSVTGLDVNRLHMVLAILDRREGLLAGGLDVFAAVVGGIRVGEPAADLALALSLASNLKVKPIPSGTVVLGELDLAGEIRPVSQLGRRLSEAARQGFKRAIIPARRRDGEGERSGHNLDLIEVSSVGGAILAAFGIEEKAPRHSAQSSQWLDGIDEPVDPAKAGR
jgi:DNA repair protein RadA/Sms